MKRLATSDEVVAFWREAGPIEMVLQGRRFRPDLPRPLHAHLRGRRPGRSQRVGTDARRCPRGHSPPRPVSAKHVPRRPQRPTGPIRSHFSPPTAPSSAAIDQTSRARASCASSICPSCIPRICAIRSARSASTRRSAIGKPSSRPIITIDIVARFGRFPHRNVILGRRIDARRRSRFSK